MLAMWQEALHHCVMVLWEIAIGPIWPICLIKNSIRWDEKSTGQLYLNAGHQGLTLSICFTCPSDTWFRKFMCPAKIFTCPTNICTSPVKLGYCWKNKYMLRLKNHLASWAYNHKRLCALGQDLHALCMRECLNSLWPSDAIWRQRSGSTLAQVMACCLLAPSHYLNQRWLIINEIQWHSY